MNRIPMSKAGTALLRALLSRALVEPDRILLTDYRSSDWQSLTFVWGTARNAISNSGPDAQKKTYEAVTGNLTMTSLRFRADPCRHCSVRIADDQARRLDQLWPGGADDRD